MSFIKSIVGWFKRRESMKIWCISNSENRNSDVLYSTSMNPNLPPGYNQKYLVGSMNQTAVNTLQVFSHNPFGLVDHFDKTFEISQIDNDITSCKAELLSAKRRKKKVSHIHKKLEVLVARKLELEGK